MTISNHVQVFNKGTNHLNMRIDRVQIVRSCLQEILSYHIITLAVNKKSTRIPGTEND